MSATMFGATSMKAAEPVTQRRRDNLALIYQNLLTVVVRLRANRQPINDCLGHPDGSTVDKVGLTPDLAVGLANSADEYDVQQAGSGFDKDVQLNAALGLLAAK